MSQDPGAPQSTAFSADPPGPRDPGPLRGWVASLGEALLAPLCQLCAQPAPWDTPLCGACAAGIVMMAPGCPRCGEPGAPELCQPCVDTPPAFDRARSFGIFEGPLREAIHALKFEARPQVGAWLGAALAEALPALMPAPAPTLVVPVPLPAPRLKSRGYNQAALLAAPIAAALGVPLMDALDRESAPGNQSKVGGRRRRARLKGAFVLKAQVRAHRILLIDDVYTTGSTANACARALIAEGAAAVDVYTAARAPA